MLEFFLQNDPDWYVRNINKWEIFAPAVHYGFYSCYHCIYLSMLWRWAVENALGRLSYFLKLRRQLFLNKVSMIVVTMNDYLNYQDNTTDNYIVSVEVLFQYIKGGNEVWPKMLKPLTLKSLKDRLQVLWKIMS